MRQIAKESRQTAILLGVGWGCAAAVTFGATLPLLAWAGAEVGPFLTAALLYGGAFLAAVLQKPFVREAGAPLTRRELPALLFMAFAGAALAPTLLAWGLQRTNAVTSGLLLNGEVAWTVLLARIAFRETLGRRGGVAVAMMVAGGLVLALNNEESGSTQWLGVVAVAGATLAWAVDNTASRRLSEREPLKVVMLKGGFGALITTVAALLAEESMPPLWKLGVLLFTGATGYGLSLRFYLLAQRHLGAARTASVYSLAPFVGAALGLIVTPAAIGWPLGIAAVLFIGGVILHAAERHEHQHRHEAVEHEHAHRHDDGHHSHLHEKHVQGEHSHSHRHEAQEHFHDHGPDIHHGHTH